MLLVKTRLGASDIHGIGLFADEFIPEGAVIWRFDATFDVRFDEREIARLSEGARAQIEKYSYREKHSRLYVLCGDDARFFNHSTKPNCLDFRDENQDATVALRDIEPGEELTCDYALFDLDLVEGKYEMPIVKTAESTVQYL